MVATNISSITSFKAAKIDRDFLLRAWENCGFRQNSDLSRIVNFCHNTPFYHDLNDNLFSKNNSADEANEKTELVAACMINLLKNDRLTPPYRKELSRTIIQILQEAESLNTDNADEKNSLTDFHGLSIPHHAAQLIDGLVKDTNHTIEQYRQSIEAPDPHTPQAGSQFLLS